MLAYTNRNPEQWRNMTPTQHAEDAIRRVIEFRMQKELEYQRHAGDRGNNNNGGAK